MFDIICLGSGRTVGTDYSTRRSAESDANAFQYMYGDMYKVVESDSLEAARARAKRELADLQASKKKLDAQISEGSVVFKD